MVSSTPMMVMTTSSSIKVKPRLFTSPLAIDNSVQPLAGRHGVHVEHIVSGLRIAGRTLITAQPPGLRGRHRRVRKERIARHAPQKIYLSLFLAGRVVHPVDQH